MIFSIARGFVYDALQMGFGTSLGHSASEATLAIAPTDSAGIH